MFVELAHFLGASAMSMKLRNHGPRLYVPGQKVSTKPSSISTDEFATVKSHGNRGFGVLITRAGLWHIRGGAGMSGHLRAPQQREVRRRFAHCRICNLPDQKFTPAGVKKRGGGKFSFFIFWRSSSSSARAPKKWSCQIEIKRNSFHGPSSSTNKTRSSDKKKAALVVPSSTARLLDGRPVFRCWRTLTNSARCGRVYGQIYT